MTLNHLEDILSGLLDKARRYLAHEGELPACAFFVRQDRLAGSMPLRFHDDDEERVNYEVITNMAAVQGSDAVIVVYQGYSRFYERAEAVERAKAISTLNLEMDVAAHECIAVAIHTRDLGRHWYEQPFHRDSMGDVLFDGLLKLPDVLTAHAVGNWWEQRIPDHPPDRCDFCDGGMVPETAIGFDGPTMTIAFPGVCYIVASAASEYRWRACATCAPWVRCRDLQSLVTRAREHLAVKSQLPAHQIEMGMAQAFSYLFSYFDQQEARRQRRSHLN